MFEQPDCSLSSFMVTPLFPIRLPACDAQISILHRRGCLREAKAVSSAAALSVPAQGFRGHEAVNVSNTEEHAMSTVVRVDKMYHGQVMKAQVVP